MESVELRSTEQAVDRHRLRTTVVGTGEQPALAPEGDGQQLTPCGADIDLNAAVVAIAS
jgi:hypothetical protein